MSWLKAFIERLANASKKEFGNDRLDCCKNDLHDQQAKPPAGKGKP